MGVNPVARDGLLMVVGLAVAALAGLMWFSGGQSGSSTSSTGSSTGGSGGMLASIVKSTPAPDGLVKADPIVNPVNTVTDGAVYQGPDPLDLAPGEEGRGDLIGPVNPGNVVAGGPVYTGPDPLNLGGN